MFGWALNWPSKVVRAVAGSQVPAGSPTSVNFFEFELRLQHVHVAFGEQGRVVVGRSAAHHQDVRVLHVPGGDALDHALADQLADLDIVEAHVIVAVAAERQAIVVDDRHAVGLGVGFDRGADAGRDRIHHQHRRALGDVRLRLGQFGRTRCPGRW